MRLQAVWYPRCSIWKGLKGRNVKAQGAALDELARQNASPERAWATPFQG